MPKRGRRGPVNPVGVEALVHRDDQRTNIPTAELEGFLKDEDRESQRVTYERSARPLYPRDPAGDPQLVWRGKEIQDQGLLGVSALPIYIQEKVAPKAIVEGLRTAVDPDQTSLFEDFNALSFEEAVDFYQHEQNWSNRMILGDSLLVMTSLADKEALKGQVQMIYLDPPYGIKFGSNWQVSTRKRDVRDGHPLDATRQPEQIKAFRDTWEDDIHSYLTYMRDRLVAARALLSETGNIFVQISADNVHLIRSLLDEVFLSENFVSLISFATTSGFQANELARAGDYLVWYARNKSIAKIRRLWLQTDKSETAGYRWLMLQDGTYRGMTAAEAHGQAPVLAGARLYKPDNIQSQGASGSRQPFSHDGKTYEPGDNSHWKAEYPAGMNRLAVAGRIHVARNSIQYVRYADDFGYRALNNIWTDTGTGNFTDDKIFVVQTNTKVIERCVLMTTDPGDLVLDPTCGSGTTAFVAEQWGRRWITIDTSRVAMALARTRLMSARYPFYLLLDSPKGRQAAADGQSTDALAGMAMDLRKGFVYREAPHVTLKSISSNPEIVAGMSRDEIDKAIARHAEHEKLYDDPVVDARVVRVAGPFTVESLSPHLGEELGDSASEPEHDELNRFHKVVLDYLRKSGIQNTVRDERLRFDSLEIWPGAYVQAAGDYSEAGQIKRAAICIGPQYGTVTADLVRAAAKEAVKHFDLLVVCGFAFDGYVAEETKQLGGLTVLRAAMNPDMALADDLLKKTGAGNLFMVFGEPDVSVDPVGDRWRVAIYGVDVYDPTTGQVRSHSTDDIACWLLDTDYNGESFYVRHAYFLGKQDPYKQLRKALKADIDSDAWASLYSATSRPFAAPTSGRIAVKVINHYGDEVLKVYSVDK